MASASSLRLAPRVGRPDHDRMRIQVLGGEHRRRHLALEIGGHLEAEAVEQGGADVGDLAPRELRGRRDAGPAGEEDAVGMVGARDLSARLDDRQLVLDRHEAEVAQHQQQVGRVVHRRAGKDVLALVDLGDDALAGDRIAERPPGRG